MLPVKAGNVLRPSAFVLLGDGYAGSPAAIVDGRSVLWRHSSIVGETGMTNNVLSRHTGTATIAFADGHVDNTSLNDLFVQPIDKLKYSWNIRD